MTKQYSGMKEWARDNGWPNLPNTRGRPPKDVKEAFDKAYAKDPSILIDKNKGKTPKPVREKQSRPAAAKVQEAPVDIPDLRPARYPENMYQAYAIIEGEKVYTSMRNGCYHCPWSLTHCECELVGRDPMTPVFGSRGAVPVVIERIA